MFTERSLNKVDRNSEHGRIIYLLQLGANSGQLTTFSPSITFDAECGKTKFSEGSVRTQ